MQYNADIKTHLTSVGHPGRDDVLVESQLSESGVKYYTSFIIEILFSILLRVVTRWNYSRFCWKLHLPQHICIFPGKFEWRPHTWVNIDWWLWPALVTHGPLRVENPPVLWTWDTFIGPPGVHYHHIVIIVSTHSRDWDESRGEVEGEHCCLNFWLFENHSTPLILSGLLRFTKSISPSVLSGMSGIWRYLLTQCQPLGM